MGDALSLALELGDLAREGAIELRQLRVRCQGVLGSGCARALGIELRKHGGDRIKREPQSHELTNAQKPEQVARLVIAVSVIASRGLRHQADLMVMAQGAHRHACQGRKLAAPHNSSLSLDVSLTPYLPFLRAR